MEIDFALNFFNHKIGIIIHALLMIVKIHVFIQ